MSTTVKTFFWSSTAPRRCRPAILTATQTDQPLVLERGSQSYHYHNDHLGSIRKLTSSTGAVVNSADYDAYGNREAVTETVASPYSYTGREFDPESGLLYYRARYYDPQNGAVLD